MPLSLSDSTLLLHVLVVLSGVASGLLAAVGLMAFSRRRSAPYLLVALALVFLAGKAVVAMLSLAGVIGFEFHNLIEHGLDFLIATLLIIAIVEARNPRGCWMGRWLGQETD